MSRDWEPVPGFPPQKPHIPDATEARKEAPEKLEESVGNLEGVIGSKSFKTMFGDP